jgi:hypothetical protein
MYTIILGAVIGGLIALFRTTRSKESFVAVLIISLISAFCGALVGLFGTGFVGSAWPQEWVYKDIPIHSLNNNSELSGSFLHIDTQRRYYYWYEDKGVQNETGLREGVLYSRDDPLVIEQDRTDGVLREYYTQCTATWEYSQWGSCTNVVNRKYQFYVPKGTVIDDFLLD